MCGQPCVAAYAALELLAGVFLRVAQVDERSGRQRACAFGRERAFAVEGVVHVDTTAVAVRAHGNASSEMGYYQVEIFVASAVCDKKAELVLNGMIYSIAKWIGGSAVVLKGQVDAILLTGGVAYSDYVIERLSEYIGFIAPISVYPGENEMLALAANGLGALQGTIEVKEYK